MADIVHLIVSVGQLMSWERLLEKTGEHWPLLLSQLQMFNYVYPEISGAVPRWVMTDLLDRARADAERPRSGDRVTRGTFVSRFSFAIDINEWGFRDLCAGSVEHRESQPVIREIVASDVWDERSPATHEYATRIG